MVSFSDLTQEFELNIVVHGNRLKKCCALYLLFMYLISYIHVIFVFISIMYIQTILVIIFIVIMGFDF